MQECQTNKILIKHQEIHNKCQTKHQGRVLSKYLLADSKMENQDHHLLQKVNSLNPDPRKDNRSKNKSLENYLKIALKVVQVLINNNNSNKIKANNKQHQGELITIQLVVNHHKIIFRIRNNQILHLEVV